MIRLARKCIITTLPSLESVQDRRTALVIAHPGHELCVYGWLKQARPNVLVLTDGSGRSSRSRIDSTTKVLSRAQAKPGVLYGWFTDRDFYTAIIDHDFKFFEEIVTVLAKVIIASGCEAIAGDAAEGYNPIHDICRMMINAAIEIAVRESDLKIVNRDFLLFGRHHTCLSESRIGGVWLELTDEVFEEKLELARNYPELKSEVEAALDGKMLQAMSADPELGTEVASVISAMGREAYRLEELRAVGTETSMNKTPTRVPFYERYGELLVAAGYYDRPIRYLEHIYPLAEAMRRFVDQKTITVHFPN